MGCRGWLTQNKIWVLHPVQLLVGHVTLHCYLIWGSPENHDEYSAEPPHLADDQMTGNMWKLFKK